MHKTHMFKCIHLHTSKWMHHFHALSIDFGNKDCIFIVVKWSFDYRFWFSFSFRCFFLSKNESKKWCDILRNRNRTKTVESNLRFYKFNHAVKNVIFYSSREILWIRFGCTFLFICYRNDCDPNKTTSFRHLFHQLNFMRKLNLLWAHRGSALNRYVYVVYVWAFPFSFQHLSLSHSLT